MSGALPPGAVPAVNRPDAPGQQSAPPIPRATGPAAGQHAPAPDRSTAPKRIGLANVSQEGDIDLDAALREMIAAGASDLHLTSGAQPMIRLDGGLKALDGFPTMYPEALQRTLYAVLTQKQRETFEDELELDFAYAVRGVSRFRVNLYKQRDSVGAAFRMIPYEIKPLEELGVPPVVANFAGMARGLVLVTGPTGSGKSTTLAAIVDLANRSRNEHIMTVEDPIEFLHRHKKSLINQREVGADTHSFAQRAEARAPPGPGHHPGRRDARPGDHLRRADRRRDRPPGVRDPAHPGRGPDDRPHHRRVPGPPAGPGAHAAGRRRCRAWSARRSARRANGKGRVVATEVMLATPAIRNLIREGKTHQIYSAMQAGASHGMHTMDQHLAELVKSGKITYEARPGEVPPRRGLQSADRSFLERRAAAARWATRAVVIRSARSRWDR